MITEIEIAVTDANIEVAQFDVTRDDAIITIENTETGNHRTFRIRTARKGNLKGKRIVSLLSGPSNDDAGDWQGFGFADEFGIMVWSKFRGQSGHKSDFDVFASMLQNPTRFSAKGALYHIATTCKRCGRRLTTPESVTSGFGPECRSKGLS